MKVNEKLNSAFEKHPFLTILGIYMLCSTISGVAQTVANRQIDKKVDELETKKKPTSKKKSTKKAKTVKEK